MSEIVVDRVGAPHDKRGDSLKHTCAIHPFAWSGDHDANCRALCGWRPGDPGPNGPQVRDADSCVVCNAMFDAMVRGIR